MRIHMLATAFALGAVVPAIAADAVVDEVVVVDSAYNWSGVYLGAQIGYAWGDSRWLVTLNNIYSDPDPEGAIGGIYLGFNHQFDSNVVVGLEGDFTFANVRGDDIAYFPSGLPAPRNLIDVDMNWSGSVRGRLGYAFDRLLPYVTAGLAFADYDSRLYFDGFQSGDFSDTYTGWTIGAGLDYAFSEHVILRGEYRYSDFGSKSYDWVGRVAPHDLDLTTNDIRLGIAYKF